MEFKISDGARALIDMRHIDASDDEIMNCCKEPDKTGEAFGKKCFAKQFGNKAVCAIAMEDGAILEVLSVIADLSQYDNAGDFYEVQFSAAGDKGFYKAEDGFTAIGNIQGGGRKK